jgi:hypothetical protein
MRARYDLINALLKINTKAAVESGLSHALDLCRLNGKDHLKLRSIAPSFFLCLGHDQECYDFCKWWAVTGPNDDYDWGDLRSPHLDLRGENVFEDAGIWKREEARDPMWTLAKMTVLRDLDLGILVAVTLVKIRILLDLRTLQRMKQDPSTSGASMNTFSTHALSSVIRNNPAFVYNEDLAPSVKKMEEHSKQLYFAVMKANLNFWHALMEPGPNGLTATPKRWGIGDDGESQIKL